MCDKEKNVIAFLNISIHSSYGYSSIPNPISGLNNSLAHKRFVLHDNISAAHTNKRDHRHGKNPNI